MASLHPLRHISLSYYSIAYVRLFVPRHLLLGLTMRKTSGIDAGESLLYHNAPLSSDVCLKWLTFSHPLYHWVCHMPPIGIKCIHFTLISILIWYIATSITASWLYVSFLTLVSHCVSNTSLILYSMCSFLSIVSDSNWTGSFLVVAELCNGLTQDSYHSC